MDSTLVVLLVFIAGTVFGLILPSLPHNVPIFMPEPGPVDACFSWNVGKRFDPPSTEWYNEICPNLSSYDGIIRYHYGESCACYEEKHKGFFQKLLV